MISKILLGTVQFGIDYGINNYSGKPSLANSLEILNEAYASGVRVLDTAESYGNSHEIIGLFHKLNPDKNFKVITKFATSSNSENIVEKLERYLKEMNIKIITGFLFHSFKSYELHKKKLEILNEIRKDGIVKYIGASVYTNNEFESVLNDKRIDLIQLPFNLIDNYSIRGKLLERAKNEGKIIHTRSVFLQGLFFKNVDDQHKAVRNLKSQLLTIHEIANRYALTLDALALNYCLCQDTIDGIIIGVDSLAQLRSNISNIGLKLPEEIFTKVNKIVTNDMTLLNPSLWA